MSKFNPFLYIVIPLAVEIQFVEASIDASRIQNKMASLVASIRRGPECPEWIRINGKLGNGELAEQSIIEVGNILQAQSENYTSVLPIYCGNLTPANLNWIGVCYAVKSLCLQVRDYFATKVFSQIIDDITDKAVAKTSVYYDLTDLQIDNLRHDLSYYLRGLKISELVRTFRATHPAVNKLINQAEGWESFLGTSPASAKLARAFKRVIRDGSLEQLVIEAQNQGDFDIRDWFRDWKSDQSIGQIVEVIVNESFQGASGLEAKIGTLPELAVGDMLRSEFRKLFTTRQPILQTLDEQISALSEIPSLPAESPTIILIPEPALQPLPAYHLEPPNLVSRTVRRKAPTRRAAVREVSDLSPSVTEVPNVVGREVSAPSPSVTEVPNVVGREVPDLSPSVTEVPNVVGREVPAPSPSVTEVPNVVGREVPAPSPSVIEVPPPAVEDTLSAMNREREDQPPSAHLLRFAELLELTIGKNFPTLEGDIIKFGKERIVESRLIDSGDKKRILMCNWMEALAELKQKKVYEIPPDVLTKLPMQDLITDVGYSLAALMLKTSKKIQDKLAKEAKAFQRESGDVIPVSVSGVYGLVFESPVHYTRIIKDRSLKIYQFIIDENTRFRTIARNRPDLAYTLEDVRCGMSEFLEEAGRALGYPDQNTITAEQLISPVFKFPKPIPALTRDDVLQTLMRNIRRIS